MNGQQYRVKIRRAGKNVNGDAGTGLWYNFYSALLFIVVNFFETTIRNRALSDRQ